MKKLSTYLTNYTAPSAGFSEGKFKDDPGDSTGSGAVVQTINDLWYGIETFAKKYIGGISDTDESETSSDILESIEKLAGVANENVSDYSGSTTYAQDDHVMYLGLQFVSMINSNAGNTPIDNPDKWIMCHNRDEALLLWQKGEDISGGFHQLHDIRDVTNYRQIFKMGKYNFGGDSGRNYQCTGLHLDGDTVTGDATLVALLDVGGADEYHLLDIIAPDVLGIRTLLDSKGRVSRSVDGTGGDTEDVGLSQEDAMQKITGHFEGSALIGVAIAPTASGSLQIGTSASRGQSTQGGTGTEQAIDFDNSQSTSPNAAKTDDDETRMKNYTKGLSYILIMQEI